MIITMEHVYQAGGCAPGALKFLKRYKLDYKKFFKGGGLPEEDLIKTKDRMALHVVEVAKNG